MKVHIICYVAPELPNVGKIWFLRYGSKYFWPIKLQGSSKCKISRKKWGIKLHGFCTPPILLDNTTLKLLKYFIWRKKFWKYGRGRNLDRGRWQGRVVDSNLTFSSEFCVLYHDKKNIWERFFHLKRHFSPRKHFNLHACIIIDLFSKEDLMDSKDIFVYSIQYLWQKTIYSEVSKFLAIFSLLLAWGSLLYFTYRKHGKFQPCIYIYIYIHTHTLHVIYWWMKILGFGSWYYSEFHAFRVSCLTIKLNYSCC